MFERLLLLAAAVMIALLFIYAVVISPPKPEGNAGLGAMNKSIPDDRWFQENVVASDIPVLIDFKAEWCGPCRLLHPHLVELEEKYVGRLKVVQVDVDENQYQKLVRHYSVDSIPMVLLFVEGKVVDGFLGYREYADIEKIVAPHLPEEGATVSKMATAATKKLVSLELPN